MVERSLAMRSAALSRVIPRRLPMRAKTLARPHPARWTRSKAHGAFQKWTEILSTVRLTPMSTIGAAKFKQECLAILDRLGPEGIVITKHGKPVAKLIPIETGSASLIGSLAGKIRVHGDLLT